MNYKFWGILLLSFLMGLVLLIYGQDISDLKAFRFLPCESGTGATLWQVQVTLLSVGFAGIAVATQLFVASPLVIGASRDSVLNYIGAHWLVGIGLTSSILMGIETIWFPSPVSIAVLFLHFLITICLLVRSSQRLLQLYSNPARLDGVTKESLTKALKERLTVGEHQYEKAQQALDELPLERGFNYSLEGDLTKIQVPVPRPGHVIRRINPNVVAGIINKFERNAISTNVEKPGTLTHLRIHLHLEPGDRMSSEDALFTVETNLHWDTEVIEYLVSTLQSSIELEGQDAVTPDEEIGREIDLLRDTIGISLRNGAHATAQHGIRLLGEIVEKAWQHDSGQEMSSRTRRQRREWRIDSINAMEQDSFLLSENIAMLLVNEAYRRSALAPRLKHSAYIDACLNSLGRMWDLTISQPEQNRFRLVEKRIPDCVQMLAASPWKVAQKELSVRSIWALVEFVKRALDFHRPDLALEIIKAIGESTVLFKKDQELRRATIAGQLILLGWLDFLASEQDIRDPEDEEMYRLLMPYGTKEEILEVWNTIDDFKYEICRWTWWEITVSRIPTVTSVKLPSHIDNQLIVILSEADGKLPKIHEQDIASAYRRLVTKFDGKSESLSPAQDVLKQELEEHIREWEEKQKLILEKAKVSEIKTEKFQDAVRDALLSEPRLANEIVRVSQLPTSVKESTQLLGINFLISKEYFVDEIIDDTYADVEGLGLEVARAHIKGEDIKIIDSLRSVSRGKAPVSVKDLIERVHALGEARKDFILVTPYGGLGELEDWYSRSFQEALREMRHFKISELDAEGFLFDRRNSLISFQGHEEAENLIPIDDTAIAFGVFTHEQVSGESKVRVETGERFMVWPAENAEVIWFSEESSFPETVGEE